ncbi:hypothetical protein NUSPORA_01078 [Nucleospora cyclopteri]
MIILHRIIGFLHDIKSTEENIYFKEKNFNVECEDSKFDDIFANFETSEVFKSDINWSNSNMIDNNWNNLIDEVLTEQNMEFNNPNTQNIFQYTKSNLIEDETELNFLQYDLLEDLSCTSTEKILSLNDNSLPLQFLETDNNLDIYANNLNNKSLDLLINPLKDHNQNMSKNDTSNLENEQTCIDAYSKTNELIEINNDYKCHETTSDLQDKNTSDSKTCSNTCQPNIYYETDKLNNINEFNQETMLPLQTLIDLSEKQIHLLNRNPFNIDEALTTTKQLFTSLNAQKQRHQDLLNIIKEKNNKLSSYELHLLKNNSLGQISSNDLLTFHSKIKEDHFLQVFSNINTLDTKVHFDSQQETEISYSNCNDSYKTFKKNFDKTTLKNLKENPVKENNYQAISSLNNANVSALDSSVINEKPHFAQNESENTNMKEDFSKNPNTKICESQKLSFDCKMIKNNFKQTTDFKTQQFYENKDDNIFNELNHLHKVKSYFKNNKVFFGDLSSGEIEYNDDCISEDKDDIPNSLTEYPDPKDNILYKPRQLIFYHTSAEKILILTDEINYLLQSWITLYSSENDLTILPEEISFTPGWYNYKLIDHCMCTTKMKDFFCLLLCKAFGLEKYFSLIFNMIRINTYKKKNQKISFHILFHLVCYHFCSKYNLGNRNILKYKFKFYYINLINNKNYYRIFKTKIYWRKKAESLFIKAKEKALNELKISQSSFTPFHLYNILHLILQKQPSRIAYTFYVYFASIRSELDKNLNYIAKDEKDLVIEKRKNLFKLRSEFKNYLNCAKSAFFRLLKKYKKNS